MRRPYTVGDRPVPTEKPGLDLVHHIPRFAQIESNSSRADEHLPGLRALGRPQNPGVVKLIHDTSGPPVPDLELSLGVATWNLAAAVRTPRQLNGTDHPDPRSQRRRPPSRPPPLKTASVPGCPIPSPPRSRPSLCFVARSDPRTTPSCGRFPPWRCKHPESERAHSSPVEEKACPRCRVGCRRRSGRGWCANRSSTTREKRCGTENSP